MNNNGIEKMELKRIEHELSDLIEADKRNWTHFYILIKKVEDESLWEGKYSSFTQWVKNFCVTTKTHESIFWNRKKAGKVYESYQKIQAEKGIEVPPIEQANVSADSLVILDKINKYDQEVASQLVEKVINRDITKKDLREVYKSIRPEKPSRNPHIKFVDLSEIEEKSQESKEVEGIEDLGKIDGFDKAARLDEAGDQKNLETVTARDIVYTISDIEWLGEKPKRKYFKSSFEQNKYRIFTEFPVYVGTSRKSRRMDMLLVENIMTDVWDLNLHCIEIKVSKSDLLNDMKYTEYAEFVDFMWLAVPDDLVEIAKSSKFNDCGIISVSKNGAVIVEQAKKLDADRKIETLKNIALKLI
jgi:hypothetical protein